MKKKLLSTLLALCMVLTLLPAAALAANATSVNVGSVTLNSTGADDIAYATVSGNTVATVGATAANYNAKFENGTLTLKDFSFTGAPAQNCNGIIDGGNADLTVVLEGTNAISTSTADARAIVTGSGGTLTITGSGTVTATNTAAGGKAVGPATTNTTHNIYAGSAAPGTLAAASEAATWNNAYIKMEPGKIISGTITDSEHYGISGATVQLQKGEVNFGAAATTNDYGQYTTQTVPAGEYKIKVSKSGYLDGTITSFAVGSTDNVTGKNLALTPAPAQVWVGGTNVVHDTNNVNDTTVTYWVSDGAGGITGTGASDSNYTVKYDPNPTGTPKLTLNGAEITKNFRWEGDYATAGTPNRSAAIVCDKALEIILTAGTMNRLEGNAPQGFSGEIAGAYIGNKLTISGTGALYATGNSFGIYSSSAEIKGGVIDAVGNGRGYYSSSRLDITGGTLTAVGNTSAVNAGGGAISGIYDTTKYASTDYDGFPSAEFANTGASLYTYKYLRIGPAATVETPVITPGTETYNASQTVTITCATPIARIYYTTNGDDPTTSSTLYTGPITVSSTSTVKAKAFKGGMTASSVASATYTFTAPPAEAAPVAEVQNITGTLKVGQTLTGHYTYSDVNGDLEGASTFKWYRADDAEGTNKVEITDAEAETYVLTSSDLGKYISFEVTPVAETGTSTGVAVESNLSGPVEAASSPSIGGYTPPLVTEIKSDGSSTAYNLDRLISGKYEFTVTGEDGAKMVFDTEALKGIDSQTADSVTVKIEDVSEEHQDTHEGKTVFTLTVMSGGKVITDFGGSVTVSLPYTLKEGETAEDVTVWYLATDGTMTEIVCTYDSKTELATFTASHFSEYVVGVEAPWVNPFTDVKEGDWFYDDVAYANKKGLMNGISDTAFDPYGVASRGMIVTMLWRLEGEPAVSGSCPFDDVESGKYYEKAITWAAANKIVDGYGNGKFGPDDPITREQLAAVLYRCEQYKGGGFVGSWMFLLDFPDAAEISGWADEAMHWCVMNGLIEGSDGKLLPQGGARRSQAAAILHRYCQLP